MHVVLVLARRIEVDHVRDVVEIQPARRDVRGDERRHLAALESGECALACSLRHVAVHGNSADVLPGELLHELVRAALRPYEDQGQPV